jgi:tryptophan synthase alpha chain
MSERYKARFERLKKQKHKAFMPFTLLGWPNKDKSLAMIKQMIDAGASALELGFAFSDPVADGPVIQEAAFETLESGFSVDDGFKLLTEVRALDNEIPIGILVYYNLVMKKGLAEFFEAAAKAGVDGVLIADLPVDFNEEITPIAKANKIAPIYLISPVSPEARVRLIAKQASGFIYLLSRLGVTGVKAGSSAEDGRLANLIKIVREESSVPICAGFGISSAETATRMIESGVDGVITGSKVIDLARQPDYQSKLDLFYREMLGACEKADTALVQTKS